MPSRSIIEQFFQQSTDEKVYIMDPHDNAVGLKIGRARGDSQSLGCMEVLKADLLKVLAQCVRAPASLCWPWCW